jgi:hypothetical protein
LGPGGPEVQGDGIRFSPILPCHHWYPPTHYHHIQSQSSCRVLEQSPRDSLSLFCWNCSGTSESDWASSDFIPPPPRPQIHSGGLGHRYNCSGFAGLPLKPGRWARSLYSCAHENAVQWGRDSRAAQVAEDMLPGRSETRWGVVVECCPQKPHVHPHPQT